MLYINLGHLGKIQEKESKIKIYLNSYDYFLLIFINIYLTLSTWMILEEYTALMSNFIDHDFPVRELPVLFINSMRIQIDEIESDRHYNMTFPEFLEAFCRVVDKASPIPIGEKHVII